MSKASQDLATVLCRALLRGVALPLFVLAIALSAIPSRAAARPLESTEDDGVAAPAQDDAASDDGSSAGEGEDNANDEKDPEHEGWVAKYKRATSALQDATTFSYKEGMFTLRAGVRFQVDVTLAQGSDLLEQRVGTVDPDLGFRRLRLFLEGGFLRRYTYRISGDFSADAGLKDAFVDGLLQRSKVLQLRVGNFKEPFSLDRHNSGFALGFFEFSLPVATFAPGRNAGAALHNTSLNRRFSWAAGAFTNTGTAQDNQSASNITLTGRATGLPLLADGGRKLVHLGVSYSLRDPQSGTVQYVSRPEARFVQPFLDTGEIDADTVQLTSVEVAAVHGPYWAQFEWLQSKLNTDVAADPTFVGAYIQMGYFLTGDSRPYRYIDGTFGRLNTQTSYKRGNPFKRKSDRGAFEITGRFSTVDLTDQGVFGGHMEDLTLGFSWYLNPIYKAMVEYVHSSVDGGGSANIFLFRFQSRMR